MNIALRSQEQINPKDILACTLTELNNLENGSYIYVQGESASSFYCVTSGIIGLYHVLESGKESLLRLYKIGDFFGYRTLFSQGQTYHCSAKIMKTASVICIHPNVEVTKFLDINHKLARHLMFNLSAELQDAETRLSNQAYTKTLDRVFASIRYLCTLYPEYKWTYREIAEYAGCETETAIRISKELRKTGLIDSLRKPVENT